MGATNGTPIARTSRVSTSPEHDRMNRNSMHAGNAHPSKMLREHKRYGVVVVKYTSSTGSTRRPDGVVSHVVTPKGAIMYGSLFNPLSIQRAITSSGYPILTPGEVPIPDSRAHRLLVTYCQGWHLVPFPEVFSRHSGTCFVVGDRNNVGTPFQIKVGDCFRLGSVGLVVSEMKLPDQDEQKLDAKTLQFLKDEALAFDTNEEWAALASDELLSKGGELFKKGADKDNDNNSEKNGGRTVAADAASVISQEDDIDRTEHFAGSGGVIGSSSEKFFCYMCYEMHNTTEDPLIAPCDCRGDTRFLHVQCLQKWYHSSVVGSHAQVIRTTGNGAPACKICGAAYKTNFRRQDGRKASILELENNGPYLSLVVVTHHDTNPGLFNTKFRLNFGRAGVQAAVAQALSEEELNTIVIGRSSSCAMVLDYRTVSTTHAKITYTNGKFFLADERSSNGTLVYLQDPLPLPYGQYVKVRMGRTTIALQAKRTWTAAMRSFFFGGDHEGHHSDGMERPSMVAHLQQLNSSDNLAGAGGAASVDYSSSTVHGLTPSPCELQSFIGDITANLNESKAESAIMNTFLQQTGHDIGMHTGSNLINGVPSEQGAGLPSNGSFFVPQQQSQVGSSPTLAEVIAASTGHGSQQLNDSRRNSHNNNSSSDGQENVQLFAPSEYSTDNANAQQLARSNTLRTLQQQDPSDMTAMTNDISVHPGRPTNHQRSPTLHMLDDDLLHQHLLLDDEDSATVDNSIMPLRTAQPSFMSRAGAPSLHTSHSFLGFNNNGEPINQPDFNNDNNTNNAALTSQNIQQHNYNYSANNSNNHSNNHSNHSSHKTLEVTAPLQQVASAAMAAPSMSTSQVQDAASAVHNQNSHSSSGQNSRPTSSAGRHMLSVSGLGDVLVSSAHGAQGSGIIIHSTTHHDDQPSPVSQNNDSNNNINESINANEMDTLSHSQNGRNSAALEILKQQSSRSNSSSPVVSLMSSSQRSPRMSPRHDQRGNLASSFVQSSSPQQQLQQQPTMNGNSSTNESDYTPENLLGSLPAAGRYALPSHHPRPGSSNNSSNESAPNSTADVDVDVASS